MRAWHGTAHCDALRAHAPRWHFAAEAMASSAPGNGGSLLGPGHSGSLLGPSNGGSPLGPSNGGSPLGPDNGGSLLGPDNGGSLLGPSNGGLKERCTSDQDAVPSVNGQDSSAVGRQDLSTVGQVDSRQAQREQGKRRGHEV